MSRRPFNSNPEIIPPECGQGLSPGGLFVVMKCLFGWAFSGGARQFLELLAMRNTTA